MTRSELTATISRRFPALTIRVLHAVVDTILRRMTSALASGDRIEIRGFGSFDVRVRPARTGRNPKTGELVSVPAKGHTHFKAGKELRARVEARGASLVEIMRKSPLHEIKEDGIDSERNTHPMRKAAR